MNSTLGDWGYYRLVIGGAIDGAHSVGASRETVGYVLGQDTALSLII